LDDAPDPSEAQAADTGLDALTEAASGHDASTAGDGAAVPCGPDGGWIQCGTACVDPTNNPANCNGCGHVCSSGSCGSSVTASLTTAPSGWTFNGSATYDSFAPSAELTPIANDLAGSFVYDNPIVVDAFDVQFDFRMGLNGGTRSDGIGFMIEQTGSTAVGGVGGSLGMAGLLGFGVEMDLHDNAVCGDTSGDHVGVDDLSVCNAMEGTPTSLFATGDLSSTVDLGDAHWHHAEVILANQAISVTVDGASMAQDVKLLTLQTGTPYYFGFAGATGGLVTADGGPGGFRQEVRNIVFKFPTPRCL
jgi:hypothetical protein